MGWQDRHYHREQSPYGGDAGGFGSGRPAMSMVAWLMAINCVVFLIDSVLTGSMRGGAAAPSRFGDFTVNQAVFGLQFWRWITYQFMHDGLMHLACNMIGLYFFGRLMEQWWGSRRFLAFYLLCGTSGAVLFTIVVQLAPGLIVDASRLPHNMTPADMPMVGASGAIFGILVGCAVLYPHLRVMLLLPPIPMSMRTMALVFLGIATLSLMAGSRNAGGEAAHLGGAALGFFLVRKPSVLNWANRRLQFISSRGRSPGRWERKQKQSRSEDGDVDRILVKVKEHGVHSLTRTEKKTLQRATERQRDAG